MDRRKVNFWDKIMMFFNFLVKKVTFCTEKSKCAFPQKSKYSEKRDFFKVQKIKIQVLGSFPKERWKFCKNGPFPTKNDFFCQKVTPSPLPPQ